MTELDKFKRRLVRSVSRLLKQDPVQQEIAWEQMRKETGCDCKLLWERMRALTIKKIKRLLAAGDRTENIAAVARLSLTDWLLFDLVLVHEKLDVIGRDQLINKKQTENPVLEDLFLLVQEYNIESKSGEKLLEAWVALTRHYNSRGRQASPLLLQKRWYQLKENTRANFYKLWNSYRGNQRLWDVAKLYKPTPLQSEIAKKFPHVITQPFPEWKELVDMQKIILPDQFEMQTRMKNRPKTTDDKPDIVVIEPEIETIELGDDDSDDDPTKNKNNTQLEVNLALVKQEPIEDGLSNVQILETTHVQDNDDSNSHLSSIDEANRHSLAQQMSNFLEDNSLEDTTTVVAVNDPEDINQVVEVEDQDVELPDDQDVDIPDDQDVDIPDDQDVAIPDDQDVDIPDDQDVEISDDQDVEIPDDLIKKKADEFLKSRRKTVEEQEVEEVAEEIPKEDDDIMDDIIKQKADDFVRKVDMKKLVHDVVDEFELPEEMGIAGGMHIADVGIELVDDGIEYEEEDEDCATEKTEELPKPIIETQVKEEKEEEKDEIKEDAPSPKFDLKLLMEPVVYTTKLDDMIIFKGKKFDFVELQNVIDSVIIESKPVSSRAINVETEEEVNEPSLPQSDKSLNDDLFRKDQTSLPQSDKILSDDLFTKNQTSLPQPDKILSDDLFTKNQTSLPQPDKILSDDLFTKNQTSLPQSNKMLSGDLFRKEILKDFNLDDTPDSVPLGKEITKSVLSDTKKPVAVSTNVTKFEFIDNDTSPNTENADSARQSSDDDYESDEPIDESLKVKATSYLLQKPRNRCYNPIILCKNPDFNTRLKRLTASFFSSERNRKLFTACKPMTIDLHKAFESKLINGTLYLKSTGDSPHAVRKETVEVQSSSVMPSAMPIQSLLAKDQTKINIQDLVSATVDTVDLTERKKTVNLKDLSEIRRINQNLLTAQVPPMRVESSGFVCNYPARMSVDSIETHVVEDDEKDEPKSTGIASGQDADSQPASQGAEEQPNDDTIPTNYRGRGRGWGGRGGPTRGTRGRGAPYRPQYLPSTFGDSKVTAPWRLGPKPKPSSIDDFLITIDTLNRMINKLDGTEEYKNPNKKNKRPNWAIHKDVRNSLDSNSNDTTTESEARPINTIDITAALNTSLPVPDVMENVSVTTTPAPKKPAAAPKKRSRRKFCCWSREKLSRVEFGGTNTKPATWRKHTCPIVCQCCCRDVLLQRMKLQNIESEYRTFDAIELSDEEFYATDNDSSDVRIPGFDPEEEAPPKPRLRVYSSTTSTPVQHHPVPIQPNSISSCSHTNSTCTSVCTGRGVPMSVAGVSTETGTVISVPTTPDLVPIPAPAEPQPVLRINVNFTPAPVSEVPVQPVIPPITITDTDVSADTSLLQHIATQISSVSQSTSAPQSRVPQLSPAPPPVVPIAPNSILRNTRLRKVTIPVQKAKPSVAQRQIVIDASKGPTTSITADKMEDKIMILNSKTLSKKPKESPIFLGKDTILLTTVKFPPNFGGGHTPAPPPILAPKVIPALPLPNGVQLILMPDGQLLYTVDPSVKLDAAQLAAMPSILAAVQQQINMANQQTEVTEINTAIGSITPSTSVGVGDNIDQPMNIDQEGQVQTPTANPEQADSVHVKNSDKSTAEIPTEANNSTHDANSSKDSDIITIEETDEPTNAGTPTASTSENKAVETNKGAVDNVVNDNASVSRNLLSDLMEMSGIFAEDTKLQESPTKQATTVGENTLTPAIQATSVVENIVTPAIQATPAVENIVTPAIQATPVVENIVTPAIQATPVVENIVTPAIQATPVVENIVTPAIQATPVVENIVTPAIQATPVVENIVTPAIQATPAVENIVTPAIQATPVVENIVTPAIQVMSAGEDIENPAMKVVSTSGPVETSNSINLPELSAITSLTELKYACENNGLFYKLDLNTGVIAPINVCIKSKACVKSNSSILSKMLRGPPIAPKGVIDLTDEADIPKNIIPKNIARDEDEVPKNITKEGTVKPIKLFRDEDEVPKNITKEGTVKPIKLFRDDDEVPKNITKEGTVKPIKLFIKRVVVKQPNILKRKLLAQHIIMNSQTRQIEIKNHTRKQKIQKIEAKIDLVDSDAPMEEEYLVDSSGSDDELPTKNKTSLLRKPSIATRLIESDDSSDEEPLAKKFTRLKQMNKASTQEKNADSDTQGNINEAVGDTTEAQTDPNAPKELPVPVESPKSSEMEVATDLPVPIGPPKPAALEAAEIDENLNSDEMEIEEEYMAFMAEGTESQDEDCILGV